MKVMGMLVFLLAATAAFAQTPPVEGSVISVVLDHVQVQTDKGVRVVVLPPGTGVVRAVAVPLRDIKPGDWVGVDSKPGADGAQESVVIRIFSPSIIARARKGSFTMESGDLMTNAPVDQVTVGTDGGQLTLKNDGAMVPIRVGAKAPVFRLKDATVADIKPSVKISVRGTANTDGSLQAQFVSLQ